MSYHTTLVHYPEDDNFRQQNKIKTLKYIFPDEKRKQTTQESKFANYIFEITNECSKLNKLIVNLNE